MKRTLPRGSNGIYEANSLEECLNIYKNLQFNNAKEDVDEIEIYPYDKTPYGLNFYEFKEFAITREWEKIVLKRNN